MKKIVIFMFVALFSGNILNANNVNVFDKLNNESFMLVTNDMKDYNFVINKSQLGEYLGLDVKDSVQLNNVYHTYDTFCDRMLMAGRADNEESRINLIINSIDYVTRNMNFYLDKVQYKKFLYGLNKSFHDKGFVEESCIYCWKNCK